ncbi:hypothetical protein V1264_018842 [Littorina saxatilis]|uniref:RNA polymerase II-associated protein 1 N-terminal domain-containing protein n=1 Tax=Littorina saxatilis TaxID=31220 RepID=A0AAN9BF77_9CAEN
MAGQMSAPVHPGPKIPPDMDPEELIDCQDKGLATVLTSIIERDTRNSAFTMPYQATQPFPSVVKNPTFAKPAGPKQKKSLFAQQIERQGLQDFGVMVQQESSKMEVPDAASSAFSQSGDVAGYLQADLKPHVIDGRGLSASRAEEEARSIHKENLAKLSEMSKEEILEEQRQLLQMLDPSLVAFLKSKSKPAKATASQPEPKSSQRRTKEEPSRRQDNLDELPEDVPLKESKKWVHMDKVEYDKLEWMKDLPPPSADDTKTGQQARFDFQGNVIPPDTDVPVNEALHHHGDEPQVWM